METTTAFDKQYFVNLAFSLLRHFLTAAGVWFTANNIGTKGQWDFLVLGLASGLVGLAMLVYAKYKNRVKFLTALTAPAGTDERDVKATFAAGKGVGQL